MRLSVTIKAQNVEGQFSEFALHTLLFGPILTCL
jgi:hypothetical protein